MLAIKLAVYSEQSLARVLSTFKAAPPRTPRGKPRSPERLKAEKSVKRMIAHGKSGKEICDKLGVSRSIYQRIRKEVEQ